MIPVLGGVENSYIYFNVVFIVVLASLVLQGWTVPWVARRLGLELPPSPAPASRLDFDLLPEADRDLVARSEEHTSELQSLMRISYAVFCLTKKQHITKRNRSLH